MNEDHHSNVEIDFEKIENQKENIQPIKSGRSAAQLATLFNQQHQTSSLKNTQTKTQDQSTSENKLDHPTTNYNPVSLSEHRKQGHAKFQHQIQVLENALNSKPIKNHQDQILADQLIKDPLDIYLQYVRWTIESYPSGGTTAESNLIPLLEQVTRKFFKDERYRQDLRYLKCWIFYSTQVNPTPSITSNHNLDGKNNHTPPTSSATSAASHHMSSKLILNFLIHNRIGTRFSLLYLEYFKLFEPIERLKFYEEDRFKLEQVLNFGISQTLDDDQNPKLVELLDQIQKIAQNNKNDQTAGQDDSKRKSMIKSNPKTNLKGKTKIKIFEDVEGSNSYHDYTKQEDATNVSKLKHQGEDSIPPIFSLVSQWDNLGTVNSNRKQNTLDPSTWKGQKLPMKIKQKPLTSTTVSSHSISSTSSGNSQALASGPLARSVSKFKVYEDTFSDGEEPKTENAKPAPTTNNNETKDRPHPSAVWNNDQESLLDDLLASEIQNQVHSIHSCRPAHEERNPQANQVEILKFDPLKFHSL